MDYATHFFHCNVGGPEKGRAETMSIYLLTIAVQDLVVYQTLKDGKREELKHWVKIPRGYAHYQKEYKTLKKKEKKKRAETPVTNEQKHFSS